MAKKKRVSFAGKLGQTVSDMANAATVAVTGSEIGVLELAAENELNVRPAQLSQKVKAAPKKTVAKRSGKVIKKKRAKRRKR